MAAEQTGPTRRRLRSRWGSVRVRTTLMATAVVALALLAGSFALVSLLTSMLTGSVRTSAQAQADQVAAVVSESGFDGLDLPDDDDRLVQVIDRNNEVLTSSSREIGLDRLAIVAPGSSLTIEVSFDNDDYLAVAATADTSQDRYLVVVAHALDRVAESTQALVTLLAAGLPILLLLLAATTWRVVGGALAPVEAIRREVDEVSARELHRRVPQSTGTDEISRLATTMNRMLARLEAARLRQQRFVADASHELRSPLASIRAHAETALTHPDRVPTAELAETVLVESLRVEKLVDNLLVLARTDEPRSGPQHESVDLDDLVFSEVQQRRGRSEMVLDAAKVSAGRVRGDPALLRRVVGNLLDNAGRHASFRIEITLRETGDTVLLRIDDDGAGVAREDRDVVFERFTRLDDARTRDAGGAGLGLAIVAEVVADHGGTVSLTESPTGGARFEVRLPRSAT